MTKKVLFIIFLLWGFYSVGAEEPIATEEPPAPKVPVLVDSITVDCTTSNNTKCEMYLVYDTRDYIVYILKKGNRTVDTEFVVGELNRDQIASMAIQTINVVSLFPDKTGAIDSYFIQFITETGVRKVKISVAFTGDTAKSVAKIAVQDN